MTSLIIDRAFRQWRAVREAFELYREGAYEAAETECNGVLLNDRGKRAGIDPWSLFIGPKDRAYAYASEELREHWRTARRLTFAEFEEQSMEEAA